MFPRRMFAGRMFAPRMFPPVPGVTPPSGGGEFPPGAMWLPGKRDDDDEAMLTIILAELS